MAYTLNTSHALYANLVELIGVQSGALVSHKTARTFTTASGSSFGTGTYGEHFHSLENAYSPKGATFTPAIAVNTSSNPNTTVFVVINSAANGVTGNGHLITGIAGPSIGINDTSIVASRGVSDAQSGFTADATTGTAHSVVLTRTGDTAHQVYLDKVSVGTGAGLGYNSSAAELSMLCGASGFSSITCDLVWVAVFNKVLSSAEITDLHNSLGANNAFGLVQAAGNAAPTFPGPNIGNLSGTVGTALTSNNVASKFSDTDALTFSAVGTWPPGVTVSSAGVISGTPTTAGTYASLKVRATDTAAQTVDSDTFSFTINASAHLVTVANSQQVNTASTAAIQQSGNGTITLPALKDWGTGNLKASETGVTIIINNATTGVLVALLTGQTANASGVLPTLTGLVSGTAYRVTTILADGSEGTWKYTAS